MINSDILYIFQEQKWGREVPDYDDKLQKIMEAADR